VYTVKTPSSLQTGFTSKVGPVSTDRNVAQVGTPADTTGKSDTRTLIYTYFTKLPDVGESTPILYNGDRLWAEVTLTLETAGPVAVGTMSAITPVLSGRGELLETGVPRSFKIAKGTRLYIAATGVNRVKVEISPYPWLETLTGLHGKTAQALDTIATKRPAQPAHKAK
jgi:hypothetical protein